MTKFNTLRRYFGALRNFFYTETALAFVLLAAAAFLVAIIAGGMGETQHRDEMTALTMTVNPNKELLVGGFIACIGFALVAGIAALHKQHVARRQAKP